MQYCRDLFFSFMKFLRCFDRDVLASRTMELATLSIRPRCKQKWLQTILILTWTLMTSQLVNSQLIRPVSVYQEIIQGIHDYFNNTCIILLHATPDPIESQGLEEGMQLQKLQAYLSGNHIRTAAMDFATFTSKVGLSYFHIKRPLFVLLNDFEDVRSEFSHVTSWIDMSYPTWLIFVRDETRIDDFLTDTYVPFDCTFMVVQRSGNDSKEIINEVYQIDRDKELRHAAFGSWDPVNGIKTPRVQLYQRRTDLFGQLIRVASIHDPPGSFIVRDDDGNMIGLGGFFGGILKLLQESMNCTISYRETDSWGYLANGTWTGAIELLINDKADLVAAELMMTKDRLNAIDFTTPVYSTKCRTFIKKPSTSSLKWMAYIAPFHRGIWSSVGVLIVVTSGTISIVKSIVPLTLYKINHTDTSPSNFSDIVLAVFGAFCSQGMDPSSLDPIRIIHLVIHLTSVVVLAAYSAALISSLATKTFVMPFTTMEGLLKDGTYRFGVIRDSADFSFFQNTTDKVLGILFDEVLTKEVELPNNYLDGLTRVCKEENYAFMTLDTVVSQLQSQVNCTLEPLDTIIQSSIAMAVQPRSPYRGIINNNILLIRDSGILQRLLHAEWKMTTDKLDTGWTVVEIGDILPLILVIIIGTFVSLLTLSSERLTYKKLLLARKRLKKRSNELSSVRFKMHNVAPVHSSRI